MAFVERELVAFARVLGDGEVGDRESRVEGVDVWGVCADAGAAEGFEVADERFGGDDV
jgi:hypothetical protein